MGWDGMGWDNLTTEKLAWSSSLVNLRIHKLLEMSSKSESLFSPPENRNVVIY